MLEKRRIFLLVICFAALCLSAAPAMADFLDLAAEYTLMSVTNTDTYGDGMTASTIIESLGSSGSIMDMYIKDDGGTVLQSLLNEPYDLTAMLDFTLSGNVYSATGSLEVRNDGEIKIAGDFVSNSFSFTPFPKPWGGGVYGIIEMTGSLTPQENETSLLLGPSPWVFETISLTDPSSFTHGDMMVLEFTVNYGTFQDFLADATATGSGQLEAQIHSTPIPAAVLLGIIGLGVAGLKLRKYA